MVGPLGKLVEPIVKDPRRPVALELEDSGAAGVELSVVALTPKRLSRRS